MDTEKTDERRLIYLRTIALIVLVIGALGSLGFMLYTGRNNKSIILILLFTGWVLSPFIALWVADIFSKRWPVLNRVTLHGLMLVIALGSLVSYSGVFTPRDARPAAAYLIVPLVSWGLIGIVFLITKSLTNKGK